jgi:hypothetical protein
VTLLGLETADQLLHNEGSLARFSFDDDEAEEILTVERVEQQDLVEMLPTAEVRKESGTIFVSDFDHDA